LHCCRSSEPTVAVVPLIVSAQPTSLARSPCSWATINRRHSGKGKGEGAIADADPFAEWRLDARQKG
jgi:hypothetical protein